MNRKRQSDATLAARAAKKADTSRDCFRNRLFACFGSLIHTISGALPSADKGLVSLVLRTFVKLKHGEDASLKERTRVVTVGLKTVLHDDTQTEDVIQKLKAVSDYMSECRVNASLLANHMFLTLYSRNEAFPERTKQFFGDCLKACGGSTGGSAAVKAAFVAFSAATGITALPPEPGVDQVRGYEAERMATAASTFLEYHAAARRDSIVKWHLNRCLRRNGLPLQRYKDRIHHLCQFITSTDLEDELDCMAAVRGEMQTLGFHLDDFAAIEQMVSLVNEDNDDDLKLLMTLQELYLTADRRLYEDVCGQAYTQFPGSNAASKQQRKNYIEEHCDFGEPPGCMAALPFNHTQANFITVDKKVMQQMFKMQFEQGDIWWYMQFMDPFKKKVNIPCLRLKSGRVAKNETDLLAAMQNENNNFIPWIVAPTFQTDGRQIKLQLLTAEIAHPGAPGLVNLHKEGYQVSFENQTLEDVTAVNRGVYSLRHIHTTAGLEAFDDITVIPVDPGDAVVVEGAHFPGTEVRKENVVNLMDSTQFTRVTFGSAEYREKSLAACNEAAEARRRTPASLYGMALDSLVSERKRTCNLTEFVSYCTTWNNVSSAIWNELLTDYRRGHRFERFRAVQKTIEEIAERIAPKAERESKRVVMFEDGKCGYQLSYSVCLGTEVHVVCLISD
jgi:hypothetical protein